MLKQVVYTVVAAIVITIIIIFITIIGKTALF
jgi:hypothetical protein